MKIAVIGDIHENTHNLILALDKIKELNAERILCLGDLMNKGIAEILAAFEIPVFSIWGNNDGDKVAITKTSLGVNSKLKMGFTTFEALEIENRKIFLTHYPLLAKPMANSGEFDVVFYGHDHKHNVDKIRNCLIVNPGEISAHKNKKATFALYDTETDNVEIIELEGSISVKSESVEKYFEKKQFKFEQGKSHQY